MQMAEFTVPGAPITGFWHAERRWPVLGGINVCGGLSDADDYWMQLSDADNVIYLRRAALLC